MTNVNFNQFNNYSNNFNRVNTQSVNNNLQNEGSFIMKEQQTPLEVLFPKYITQLANTTSELATMNQEQTIKMLKELFNFPKNFEQLLTQLTNNIQQNNQNLALLLLSSSLNFSSLASMLQTGSKEAMANLYQLLAQFNQIGVSLKEEQMSELTKLISFVSATSTNDAQNLKNTMLMYLPWLPLTDPDAFKLDIANKGSDGSRNSDDSVTILIATENYGNLQSDIYKTDADGIKILMVTSKEFPQNIFTQLMKEESIKYSININMDFGVKEAFNKAKNEHRKTQISMNISPGVNPFLLLISNALIKNVHIIDSKADLIEQRKEKLKDGES